MGQPRVLIVQTTPYNENTSSRSLDSYFHYWNKDNVRQIFSRNWMPCKGHCGELYQITDSRILKKWLHKPIQTGRVFKIDDLPEQGANCVQQDSNAISQSYKLGSKHTPIIELLRGLLWRKKYWCTPELIEWLDDYKPELVFYNFSYNLFLQPIVLFVAERYNIPIITAIGDDYYFNDKKSLSPAYHLLRHRFKKYCREIFAHEGSAVYVCDKIRDKYNSEFDLKGETIYFNSEVTRKPFSYINDVSPNIRYFGNIRLGRNETLCKIADALKSINPLYKLEVYSNENDPTYLDVIQRHDAIQYMGAIPYSEVQEKMMSCDIYIAAEGFRPEDINFTRYSLSTKAADGLACGAAVFAVGPEESGLIDYLKKTNAAVVCTDEAAIESELRSLIANKSYQNELYVKSEAVARKNHTVQESCTKFEGLVEKLIK